MRRLRAGIAALLLVGSACSAPSPSPSPSLAPIDGGWPTVVSHPIQSNEAAITGRVQHANGSPAPHYCVILTAGPCAVTTDASGNFTTSFLPGFAITLVIKGRVRRRRRTGRRDDDRQHGGAPINVTVPRSSGRRPRRGQIAVLLDHGRPRVRGLHELRWPARQAGRRAQSARSSSAISANSIHRRYMSPAPRARPSKDSTGERASTITRTASGPRPRSICHRPATPKPA